MKKIKYYSLVLCVLLLNVQGFSQNQKLSFHANAGIAFPKDEDINSAFETGFGFDFHVSQNISISFDFGSWKSSVNERAGKLYNGNLTLNPFLISLQFSILHRKTITPYLFVGLGFIFSRFELGEYFTIPEIKINQKVENGIGFYVGAGSLIHVTNNIAFFAEVNYLFREATGITTISDMNFGLSTEEFSVNLNSFVLCIGLKCFI